MNDPLAYTLIHVGVIILLAGAVWGVWMWTLPPGSGE